MPYQDALDRFANLLDEVKRRGQSDPLAATLATADASGAPSARTVYLTAVDHRGFAFLTDRQSRKGRQLTENPRAGLCFYWPSIHQQVIVEGPAGPVSEAESDAFWARRDRHGQLAALASRQSASLDSRSELEQRLVELRQRYGFDAVPRPQDWVGFRIAPTRIEFWRADWHHLHERLCYTKSDGEWTVSLLAP